MTPLYVFDYEWETTPMTPQEQIRKSLETILAARQRQYDRAVKLAAEHAASAEDVDQTLINLEEAKIALAKE